MNRSVEYALASDTLAQNKSRGGSRVRAVKGTGHLCTAMCKNPLAARLKLIDEARGLGRCFSEAGLVKALLPRLHRSNRTRTKTVHGALVYDHVMFTITATRHGRS